jgi:UDP-N-acetylmuramoyl-tripeptide--D-alanyl-D-alanine ligase
LRRGIKVRDSCAVLTLSFLIKALTGRAASAPDEVITDAAVDSRLVIPGALFVALPGERADGHDYVGEAFGRGAVAALVERDMPADFAVLDLRKLTSARGLASVKLPVCLRVEDSLKALQAIAKQWRASLDLRVVGITGSVGKSTTKELTADVLQQRFRTLKNPGNLNNEIGLPLTLLRLTRAHERAVLEMGFYVPGEIALLCQIAKPQVGVITNISHVHMERAGSLEAIVAGKGELVENLPPAPEGVAILNFDDPLVRQMQERTRARVMFYGLTEESDLWADEIEGLGLEGLRLVLHYAGERIHIRVPLLGRHSVHTVLRAAAVGLVEGLTWHEIVSGMRDTQTQLRLVAVQGPGGSLILDDTYNAAPPSVIAALNLLQELEGRHVAVLGDMLELGEYEEQGHRLVGARAAEVVDELYAIGKRAKVIADEAVRAGLPRSKVTILDDSQEAIVRLRGRIGQGDVVLVKGSRGVRMDHIITALEEAE